MVNLGTEGGETSQSPESETGDPHSLGTGDNLLRRSDGGSERHEHTVTTHTWLRLCEALKIIYFSSLLALSCWCRLNLQFAVLSCDQGEFVRHLDATQQERETLFSRDRISSNREFWEPIGKVELKYENERHLILSMKKCSGEKVPIVKVS